MAKKQTAQEQNQSQVQNQVAQNQQNEQPKAPQEQAQEQPQVPQEQAQEQPQVPQEQAQEQPQVPQEQAQEQPQVNEPSQNHKAEFLLGIIKSISDKLQSKTVAPLVLSQEQPVRKGIKEFHDTMIAESEARAAANLKAKEESDDSNVVTRRK